MNLAEAEKSKYDQIWEFPEYRKFSPGLENVARFFDVMQPKGGSTILDIGCGAGVAGLEFEKAGMLTRWLDISSAALLPEVPRKRFIQAPLWSNWHEFKYGYDYGFCVDVMEHIPPEYTMLVTDRVLSACRTVWFQIAFLPDTHGEMIGQQLHLTVKPFGWWLDHLRSIGNVIDARDLCGCGLFVVRAK